MQDLWPPSYSVRRSKRAKYVQLQYAPHKGLEVVLPSNAKKVDINLLLAKNRAWVLEKLQREKLKLQPLHQFPCEKIRLAALQQEYRVYYKQPYSGSGKWLDSGQTLTVFADCSQPEEAKRVIRQWLQAKGKQALIPWLQKLSAETTLQYQRVSIRGQRSCWGSCSATATISLNYKLLFLPAHLVQHILLHELCHLRYLNHCQEFWQLLSTFDPDARRHNQEIKQAEVSLPMWL